MCPHFPESRSCAKGKSGSSCPSRLDDALEGGDGAREEFRKAGADFYIDKAERQREKILLAKGKS